MIGGLLLVACGDRSGPVVVDLPDLTARIDATRAIEPIQYSVEYLIEVDEDPSGGAAISAVADFTTGLADVTFFEPITDTALSRVIVNGETSFVLSASSEFNDALPAGKEIVQLDTQSLADRGIPIADVESATAILGVLRGAQEATETNDADIEVTIDLPAALAAMSPNEQAAIADAFEGVVADRAVAEVTFAPDDTTLERVRIRIEGTKGDSTFLLTGFTEFAEVETDLSFDPPNAALVVDISEVPDVVTLIER